MLTAIKEIINPNVVLEICTSNHILTIKENDKGSKIKKLHIRGIPKDAFAFTLDYQPKENSRCFQQLSCYVNKANDKGSNKGCDLVLIISRNNDYWQILIFDLKSDKPKQKDTHQQLLNSELYIRYLLSMIEKHYKYIIDFDKIEFKQAIVITSARNSRKNPTYRPNGRYSKDSSELFTTISVTLSGNEAYVHLNQLLE